MNKILLLGSIIIAPFLAKSQNCPGYAATTVSPNVACGNQIYYLEVENTACNGFINFNVVGNYGSQWAGEITWQVISALTGTAVASGGPGTNNGSINVAVGPLNPATWGTIFNLVVNDSWGDGFNGVGGSIVIFDNGANLFPPITGNFGSTTNHYFTAGIDIHSATLTVTTPSGPVSTSIGNCQDLSVAFTLNNTNFCTPIVVNLPWTIVCNGTGAILSSGTHAVTVYPRIPSSSTDVVSISWDALNCEWDVSPNNDCDLLDVGSIFTISPNPAGISGPTCVNGNQNFNVTYLGIGGGPNCCATGGPLVPITYSNTQTTAGFVPSNAYIGINNAAYGTVPGSGNGGNATSVTIGITGTGYCYPNPPGGNSNVYYVDVYVDNVQVMIAGPLSTPNFSYTLTQADLALVGLTYNENSVVEVYVVPNLFFALPIYTTYIPGVPCGTLGVGQWTASSFGINVNATYTEQTPSPGVCTFVDNELYTCCTLGTLAANPPANVTAQCNSNIPAVNVSSVIVVSSDCPTVTTHIGDVTVGTCPKVISRTYRVTDACGDFVNVVQTITIDDVTPPVLAAPPAPVTVSCATSVPAMVNLAYTDNCDAPGSVTGVDGPLVGSSCGGTITRTWTATDACGNVSTATQIITIDDNTSPTFTAPPGPVTVSCTSNVPAMVNLATTDNCSGAGSATGVDGPLVGGPCGGTISRTWTATDACGNSSNVTQTITVDDNTAPVLAAPPAPVTVSCTSTVPAMVNLGYTDNCAAPGSVTGVDGALVGGTCGGTITRTWTATDPCGNSSSVTQIITVDDNTAPVLAAPPAPVTVSCSSNVPAMVNLGYTDNCTAPGSVTGVDGALVGGTCGGTITRTWTATDPCGNSSSVTQIITVDDNTAPVLAAPPAPVTVSCTSNVPAMVNLGYTDNCVAPGSVTGVDGALVGGTCGGTITRTWTATDPCGNSSSVTQIITVNDNIAPVLAAPPAPVTVSCTSNVPAMVNLGYTDNCVAPGSVTGVDGALVGGTCGGTITRTWTATDPCGNSSSVTQIITVNDNIAPVLAAPPAPVTVSCTSNVPAMVNLGYTDNCVAPGSVTGVDGALVGGTCGGTISRTWTATDPCGNSSSVTQIITVDDNTAPVLAAPPAPVTVSCTGNVPAMVNLGYTDNCVAPGSVTGVDGALVGGTCGGTITRTWTATDPCGNSSSVTQIITVDDNTAPVLAAPPAPVTVQCAANVPPMVNLGYTDNCSPSGSVTGSDGPQVGTNCGGTITRTWTATDLCGNSTSVTQIITIDDTTPPTGTNPTTTVVPGGPAPLADPAVVVTEADNCTVTPVVALFSESSDGVACPETITRIYSITDNCGNVSYVTHLILITDPFLPTASNPLPINVECVANIPLPDVTVVTDEADNQGTPVVTYVGEVSNGATCPEIRTRSYNVTDLCGGVITVNQTITIDDVTAPVFSAAPVAVTVECIGNIPAMTNLAYTDNCNAPGSVTGVDGPVVGTTCGGTVTRTWTISDACGNTAVQTQIITIDDNTAPVLAAPPGPVTVECLANIPPTINLGYTDNCIAPGTVVGTDGPLVGTTCGGTVTRTWTITDACGNTSTQTQIITIDDNTPPVLSASPADVTVQCVGDVPAMINLGYTDNCSAPGSVVGVDGPLVGTTCGGTITRTWTITDACGNASTETQVITIDDTTPPTASNPAATTVPGGPAPAVDVLIITDEADNCTLSPVVALFSETSDGVPCPETITRVYSITDNCGNVSYATHIITITDPFFPTADPIPASAYNCIGDVPAANTAIVTNLADNNGIPVVSYLGEVSDNGSCPEVLTRTYRVTDACGNFIDLQHIITINVTAGPVMPANGASIVACLSAAIQPPTPVVVDQCNNNLVPVITANADPACEGDKIYTFTYTDCAGNVAVYTYTYTIVKSVAPIVPANTTATVECLADVIQVAAPVVVDECGNNLVAVITSNADPICNGDKIFTYTYMDCAGNASVYTHTVTIDLTTPPVVPANDVVNVDCVNDIYIPTAPSVDDRCGNPLVPVMTENATPACVGNKIYTFTYTDCAGNVSVYTFTFVVNDNVNPTASNPAPISVPTAADVPTVNLNVVIDEADNCDASPTVTWISDVSDGNVCNGEKITRTFSVTDDCGNSILVTQEITILQTTPIVSAGPDVTVCSGNSVTLTAVNPGGALIAWNNGGIDGVPFNPAATLMYTVTATDGVCVTTDDVWVTVEPMPTVSFIADVLAGCTPLDVTFTNTTPGAMSNCVWTIEGGTTLNGCGSVSTTFTQGGLYDVTLTTTSTNGCSNSVTYVDYINVDDSPIASFTASSYQVDEFDANVSFNNTSIDGDTYEWNFGDQTNISTAENPTHTFLVGTPGNYTVQLVAFSSTGCSDTATRIIEVIEQLIYYVPNTFTPDGDSHNQTFQPIFTSGYDPYDFTLLIFNRWGEIIFESNDSTIGWDGTYKNNPVPDGMYTWTIEFKVSQNDERKIINGHVNLMR